MRSREMISADWAFEINGERTLKTNSFLRCEMTENENTMLKPEAPANNNAVEEMALMIEGLYNKTANDLRKLKADICNELKYSSAQVNSYCEMSQKESSQMVAKNQAMIQAIAKELRYGYQQDQMIHEDIVHLINDEVMGKLGTLEGKISALEGIEKALPAIETASNSVTEKLVSLSDTEIDFDAFAQKVKEIFDTYEFDSVDYEKVTEIVDSAQIKTENMLAEKTDEIVEKTSAAVAEQNQLVVDAINALKLPEDVDYERIVEDVSARVIELLREEFVIEAEEVIEEETEEAENEEVETVSEETEEIVEEETTEVAEEVETVAEEVQEEVAEVPASIDYEKIVNEVATKVVESLPYVEKIDYKQIEEIVRSSAIDVTLLCEEVADKVVEKLPTPAEPEVVDYEQLASVVSEKVPAPEMLDYERLAETVIAKMPVPETIDYDKLAETVIAKLPAPEAIDYDKLADAVIAKMPVPEAIDYEKIANTVSEKLAVPEKEEEYDVMLDEEGLEKIANGVYEKIDLDIISEKVSKMLTVAEPEALDYDKLADMVAERLAVKVEILTEPVEEEEEETVAEETTEVVEEVVEETTEEIVEEAVEEVVEEPTEEVIEEVQEEVAEETVEETVEEPVEEVQEATEEVAMASYEESGDELVDAETGLVVRLKRSFSAKLKQSEEDVKVFYDMIKNELVSYKKVKSTVSWHGDRFNLGRNTIAKMNICGKTLCFYIALDPEDPELKSTVYHQKNVGEQKAYQATPFKVKVKSEMGAKRAVRLVKILAEKISADKKPNFEAVDYVTEYAYETTKELLDKGLIKETKEKKIAFEF